MYIYTYIHTEWVAILLEFKLCFVTCLFSHTAHLTYLLEHQHLTSALRRVYHRTRPAMASPLKFHCRLRCHRSRHSGGAVPPATSPRVLGRDPAGCDRRPIWGVSGGKAPTNPLQNRYQCVIMLYYIYIYVYEHVDVQ